MIEQRFTSGKYDIIDQSDDGKDQVVILDTGLVLRRTGGGRFEELGYIGELNPDDYTFSIQFAKQLLVAMSNAQESE